MSTIIRPTISGFTIDGPTSKDLDDAIWLEQKGVGWILHVSIADLSAHLGINSNIDQKALQRGFTRYLPNDRNLSMVPRDLAENRASLLPHQERKTITFSIPLDSHGQYGNLKINRTVLTSTFQLSHDQADAAIDDPDHPLYEQLGHALMLAKKLLQQRQSRGALAIYDVNRGVMTTEEGQLVRIQSGQAHRAHLIIQEFMILTNQLAAAFCAQRDLPILFRNHTAKRVAPERNTIIHDLSNALDDPQSFDLEKLRQRVNLMMNRATCGPTLTGHYGLNLPAYAHFTSPIRRYTDLVNHRILISNLQEEAEPYRVIQLEKIADHLNDLENEIKDRRSEAFKEKARHTAAKQIRRQQHDLEVLDQKRFHIVLKVASDRGEMNQVLHDAILTRFQSSQYTARDLAFILFADGATSELWRSLHHHVMRLLQQLPDLAVSVLQMAAQIHGWSVPDYDVSSSGPPHCLIFTATASLCDPQGTEQVSAKQEATSKKGASQRAAVALIGQIVDIKLEFPPVELKQDSEKEPQELSEQSEAVVSDTAEDIEDRPIDTVEDMDRKIDDIDQSVRSLPPQSKSSSDTKITIPPYGDNPVGYLHILSQKHKWKRPKFLTNRVRQGKRVMERTIASVTAFGQKYESVPVEHSNRKQSVRGAAIELIKLLEPKLESGKIPSGGKRSKKGGAAVPQQ